MTLFFPTSIFEIIPKCWIIEYMTLTPAHLGKNETILVYFLLLLHVPFQIYLKHMRDKMFESL